MHSISATTIPLPKAPLEADERLCYLALALTPGLGARRIAALLSKFGSVRAILAAPRRELHDTPFMSVAARTALLAIDLDAARRVVERASRDELTLLVPSDNGFPPALRVIPDPPIILWAAGDVGLFNKPAVAIVGSRDHTPYGQAAATMAAQVAAEAGIVVVSGMARGLDAIAHETALNAGGDSIGVLGNGLDVIYPHVNADLYRRMRERGLLITEHAVGERPHAGAFPRRNRLISGLAQVLVVAEAAKGSGTLLTVAAALEQGKDVMVVPGPITSLTSRGTNQLLSDGAIPLLDGSDLLARYGLAREQRPDAEPVGLPPIPANLSPMEARVWNALTLGPRHLDEIATATGLPISELLGVLLGLELGGLVAQEPGNRFRCQHSERRRLD